ncbi:MAG: hypothetical protein LBD70_02105 [Bifidobacteriaceae bacterium]|jgi:hypothetical protein|nr:hypothetical protein [Bifidobacteriaceae bacterium]
MTTRRGAAKRRIVATGGALICALTLGPAAFGDDEQRDDGMKTWWDGETLNVPWDGTDEYETIAGDQFHHEAVAVPGDWIYRSLAVHNNGPCPGLLTVAIINPDAPVGEDTVNHEHTSVTEGQIGFAGMSELHWDVGGLTGSSSFAGIAHEQELASVTMLEDSVTNVRVAYKFPIDETEGKHLGFTSQAITWDLRLRLKGECEWDMLTPSDPPSTGTTPSPSPTASATPTASPPASAGPSPSAPPKASDRLPWTGSNTLFAAISAAFLIAAGVSAFWGAGWRRRSSERP